METGIRPQRFPVAGASGAMSCWYDCEAAMLDSTAWLVSQGRLKISIYNFLSP